MWHRDRKGSGVALLVLNCRIGSRDSSSLDFARVAGAVRPTRTSMHDVCSPKGQTLLKFAGEEGLVILNGRTTRDISGSLTLFL